jgi:RNA polymerase sporulation-specific sigma factor
MKRSCLFLINLLSLLLLPLIGALNSQSFPEVLSPEEEEKYLKLWQEGDFDARNTLIEHNLRLVAHIVKKFENTREDKDDLLSIGAFGLIKAVDTYNFNSNTKLATYAARCIENEILMHLRSNKKRKETSWLLAPIGEDKEGNEIRLCDIIQDTALSADEELLIEEKNARLNEALSILSDRELEIISRRYGLNNHFVETQREIAKSLNISRSYVSRIEKRALTKLYLYLKENG